MNIHIQLHQAKSKGVDRIDAQLLLLFCLGKSQSDRAWLIAHDDAVVDSAIAQQFTALCQQRLNGVPLAYLVGEKPFFGINLHVDARVLVPRPDTETLVDWALSIQATRTVLDLGTGSGAIALAIKHAQPEWKVTAIDYSADALDVARGNASRLGLDIDFVQSAWFDALKTEHDHARFDLTKFDLIISNPPYIADDDPHMAALKHEPKQALTSGDEGLDDIRRIIQDAPAFLNPDGWLLLEHGYDQAAKVRALLKSQGFSQVRSKLDLAGIERCSGGQWLMQTLRTENS